MFIKLFQSNWNYNNIKNWENKTAKVCIQARASWKILTLNIPIVILCFGH